jgi:hypothetical protein
VLGHPAGAGDGLLDGAARVTGRHASLQCPAAGVAAAGS